MEILGIDVSFLSQLEQGFLAPRFIMMPIRAVSKPFSRKAAK
jgi:hypothetical protein